MHVLALSEAATIDVAIGSYAEADTLFLQAQAIITRTKGKRSAEYATTLQSLGAVKLELGDYAQAESLLTECRNLLAEIASNSPQYGMVLAQLGSVYLKSGEYAQAEQALVSSHELLGRTLGHHHRHYATGLLYLSELYFELGDIERVRSLLEESVRITQETRRQDHPHGGVDLANLATIAETQGQYANAVALRLAARHVLGATVGKWHSAYQVNNRRLAVTYLKLKDETSAGALFAECLQFKEQYKGARDLAYAELLHDIATLYCLRGHHAIAEPFAIEARDLFRELGFSSQPEFVVVLEGLAHVYAHSGRPNDAFDVLIESYRLRDGHMRKMFAFASERQRLALVDELRYIQDELLQLTIAHFRGSPRHCTATLEAVLRRKGVTVDCLVEQRDMFRRSYDTGVSDTVEALRQLRVKTARAATERLRGRNLDAPALSASDEDLARIERLEMDLARMLPEMGQQLWLDTATAAVVACALPTSTVLVEFVRYEVLAFGNRGEEGSRISAADRYAAFVVRPSNSEDVASAIVDVVDLGRADDIDAHVIAFRREAQNETPGPVDTDQGELPCGIASQALRRAVFDPLTAMFGPARRLFIAPDSSLWLVPFEALCIGEGRYVIDEFEISYISSGRDVARFGRRESTSEPNQPEVYADPDYTLLRESAAANEEWDGPRAVTVTASEHVPTARQRAFRGAGIVFKPLSGTRDEGVYVATRLGVAPRLGPEALKSFLKCVASPAVLHLATHAYFLGDPESFSRVHSGLLHARASHGSQRANPLLLSGLALAGAQTWLNGQEPPSEAEDGILTAEDAASLDLRGTELVVLSACDTGIGEIKVGEGVFGFRRAFVLAGAKTLIMTLWKVSDPVTVELIALYYDALAAGAGRASALRDAQLAIRKRHRYVVYWGAFVCQGDPSPLPPGILRAHFKSN